MIELIIVLGLSGILAGAVVSFIGSPMRSYRDSLVRSTLVGSAEDAIGRMERDIRQALPNSIRVPGGQGTALELLHLADGARYRAYPGGTHTSDTDVLTFDGDQDFNILGKFWNLPTGVLPQPHSRLAVYATSAEGAHGVYPDAANSSDPGVITPSSETITITDPNDGEWHIHLGSSFTFEEDPEATGRIYVVDTPVTYRCTGGSLFREWSYGISVAQIPDPAGGTEAEMTDKLESGSGCQFTYQPGSSQRAGLVIIQLNLADANGERIQLTHEVHVENAP